jgi:Ca2+-binding RTX toxin-like protein
MSSIITDIDFPPFDGNGLELIGTEGTDFLNGSPLDDLIIGNGGTDFVNGGAGDDKLDGVAGNDTIFGTSGDDLILGGEGNDFIDAGSGDDLIFGDAGNDSIFGGAGNDFINGGAGADNIFGGVGNDTIEFLAQDLDSAAQDQVFDFTAGEDTLIIKGLGSSDQVSYEPNAGQISVNGEGVIKITPFQDINITTDDNDNFEII